MRLWGKLSISQSAGMEDRTQAALLSPSLLDAETMSHLLSFLLLSWRPASLLCLEIPKAESLAQTIRGTQATSVLLWNQWPEITSEASSVFQGHSWVLSAPFTGFACPKPGQGQLSGLFSKVCTAGLDGVWDSMDWGQPPRRH